MSTQQETPLTKTETNLGEILDQHMVILQEVAEGKRPRSHVNASIGVLSNVKQRMGYGAPELSRHQGE